MIEAILKTLLFTAAIGFIGGAITGYLFVSFLLAWKRKGARV